MTSRPALLLCALLALALPSCLQAIGPKNERLPGQSSGGPSPFDEANRGPRPIIRGISPSTAKPGEFLSIVGANLYGSVVVVRFEGDKTEKVTRVVDGHRLTLHLPWGAKTGDVIVSVDDKESEPFEDFIVVPPLAATDPSRAPRVDSAAPGSCRSGDRVVVRGLNFLGEGTVLVRFGGVETSALSVAPKGDALVALVPAKARSGTLDVVIDGVLSNAIPFTVVDAKGQTVVAERPEKSAPHIEEIFPPHGKPGSPIEVLGERFVGKEIEVNFLGGSTHDAHVLKNGNLLVVIPKEARTGVLDIVIDGHRSNRVMFLVDR